MFDLLKQAEAEIHHLITQGPLASEVINEIFRNFTNVIPLC